MTQPRLAAQKKKNELGCKIYPISDQEFVQKLVPEIGTILVPELGTSPGARSGFPPGARSGYLIWSLKCEPSLAPVLLYRLGGRQGVPKVGTQRGTRNGYQIRDQKWH